MNRAQKIARFNLIVILTSLLLSTIAVSALYLVVGLPMRRAVGGFGFIVICGLMGLSPLLYKKEGGKVSFDERDMLIDRKANAIGIVGAFFFLGGVAWFLSVITKMGSIRVPLITFLVYLACFVWIFVSSVAALVQYGRGAKEKHHE